MLNTSAEKKLNIKIDNLIQLFHENNYTKVLKSVTELLDQNPKNFNENYYVEHKLSSH